MFNIERQEKILDILRTKKSVTVHKLAEMVYASESTIRRDLTELEKSGRIRRTFGGAVLEETLTKEVPLLLRQNQNNHIKQQIAKKAAEHIKNGQVIFMDASSTVAHLIPFMSQFKELTVITNSPQTSIDLGKANIRNFCTGGFLLENSIAYVGQHAENFLRHIHADIMFFSTRGYQPETGEITDSSIEESELRTVMLKQARKKVFLCDSSKFGKEYLYSLCNREDIDMIISDVDVEGITIES
jgi:DeoR family fructose operon transcriptional repressor